MPGERTEAATPKRLQELRDQGRVVRSTDLATAVSVLGGFVVLQQFGGEAAGRLTQSLRGTLSTLHRPEFTDQSLGMLGLDSLLLMAAVIAPVLMILPGIGLATNLAQVGLLISGKAASPQLDRINPLAGWKRVFSGRSVVELVKTLLKATLVAFVLWQAYTERTIEVLALGTIDPTAAAPRFGALVLSMGLTAGAVLLGLGILDYGYQRWEFQREARMSRDDLREEMKQQEGDPQLRARMRQLQKKFAQGRMMEAIPLADVVITNPTHLAVALQYHGDETRAPRVVAKGADLVAQRIREIAQEHGVPLVENKPLAQALYRLVDLEEEIPAELYHAVAEVLAFVYSLRGDE